MPLPKEVTRKYFESWNKKSRGTMWGNHKREKLNTRSIIVGSATALAIFSAFGIITVLLPNDIFVRMTPVYNYDYVFLVLTSILSGTYVGLWYYTRKTQTICNYVATGGAVGGLFSFGCAICNKVLILLLGVTGVVAYFMPLQPVLGVMSVILLSYAVYEQSKFLSSRGKIK